MKIPLSKLKAMVLFFASNTNLATLGKVKLMKLFYFCDFSNIKKHGAPITYDTYVHLEHGPIPSTIMNLVNQVEDDFENAILADTIKISSGSNELIHRIVPLREFTNNDRKYFSPLELETMERICQRFKDSIGKQLEDISHDEMPWRKTNLLEIIPYSLAAEDSDTEVSKEEIELLLKITDCQNDTNN